jgi:hypothetical protein
VKRIPQGDFVNKLLTRVSEEECALLVWREFDGLSLAALSEMTRLNRNTIKVKLFTLIRHQSAPAPGPPHPETRMQSELELSCEICA